MYEDEILKLCKEHSTFQPKKLDFLIVNKGISCNNCVPIDKNALTFSLNLQVSHLWQMQIS